MYKNFKLNNNESMLDRSPFVFSHQLYTHPCFQIDQLSRIILELPSNHVMYSKGLKDLNANFDRAHIDKKNNLTLKQTLKNLKTTKSYIMVRSPEAHPLFKEIYESLKTDVAKVISLNKSGTYPLAPKLFLFIASPGSFTPFHIDRYSTFLFQIQGSKEIAIYDQFDPRITTPLVRENFADYGHLRPKWKQETDHLSKKFNFTSSQGIHIPFMAGHYVKNGQEDISISMSVIFRSNKTNTWLKAMSVNNKLRQYLKYTPTPIGSQSCKDQLKASLAPMLNSTAQLLSRLR